MKNKGFSLVELIIVIAIMAILAAAIAPALIRYIDKSRRADDVAAAETINTSAQAALSNEDAYDDIQGAMGTGSDVVIASAKADGSAQFSYVGQAQGLQHDCKTFIDEINSSQGGNAPKLKFNKKADGTNKAEYWTVGVTDVGKPIVWLGATSGATQYQIQPSISQYYK